MKNRDPVLLFKKKLLDGEVSAAELKEIEQAVEAEVARAIEFGKRGPLPVAGDVYQCMYVNPINYPRPTWQVRT